MKKQTEIPEGIRFADTQSEINFERVASGGMPSGLLVIEGDIATGKSRLAKHLIELLGEKLRVMYLQNEKSLEHIFNVEKPRFASVW
jgi:archaellum biogenesis ATPase FlaH